MEHPEPIPPGILPPDLHRRALASLCRALPPPRDGDPDDTTARDADAIGYVASLRPATPEETLLAVQFVVADAQANDVLAVVATRGPRERLKQIAQSANMMRQSRGALSLLLRVQAARMRCERIADAMAPNADARSTKARVQPTAQSLTDYRTKSHSSGNETLARLANPVPATIVAGHGLSSARCVPYDETVSRLSGNETTARQSGSVPDITVAGQSLSPAKPVPAHETVSGLSGNETTARQSSPVLGITVAGQSLSPARPVSYGETVCRSSGNETTVRRRGVVSVTAMTPDRWPGPSSASGQSTHERAVEWRERPPFGSSISLRSGLLTGTAQATETIVSRYRHFDSNGLGRTAWDRLVA